MEKKKGNTSYNSGSLIHFTQMKRELAAQLLPRPQFLHLQSKKVICTHSIKR